MKIVFMGSSEFSRIILEYLIENQQNILCVYTQPPKQSGRGMHLSKTIIQEYAENRGIEVRCPAKLRNQLSELDSFKKLSCDVAVVVSYGLIIPGEFLAVPKHGFINIHPSDLPKFRGAAPIHRTILSGAENTAICIMQMDEGLDTGDVIKRTEVDIANRPSFQELHDELATIGARDLLEVLSNIDNIKHEKQNDSHSTYASKIAKEEGRILASDTLELVERKYRAFNPWPGISVKIDGEEIKIHEADFDFEQTGNLVPGLILRDKHGFKIAFRGGFLSPKIVQKPGKSKVKTADFINGFNPQANTIE